MKYTCMFGACLMPRKFGPVGRKMVLFTVKHLTQKTASKSENMPVFSRFFLKRSFNV